VRFVDTVSFIALKVTCFMWMVYDVAVVIVEVPSAFRKLNMSVLTKNAQ